MPACGTRAAAHPERSALVKLGSFKPRGPRALLLSRSTVVRACGRLSLHLTVVSSLGGICANTPALDMAALQQPPWSWPAAAAGGATLAALPHPSHRRCHRCSVAQATAMACTIAASQLRDRYGLRECSPTAQSANLAQPVGLHDPVLGLPAQAPGPHPAHAEGVPEPHQLQPVHGLPAGQELWRGSRWAPGALQPKL